MSWKSSHCSSSTTRRWVALPSCALSALVSKHRETMPNLMVQL